MGKRKDVYRAQRMNLQTYLLHGLQEMRRVSSAVLKQVYVGQAVDLARRTRRHLADKAGWTGEQAPPPGAAPQIFDFALPVAK